MTTRPPRRAPTARRRPAGPIRSIILVLFALGLATTTACSSSSSDDARPDDDSTSTTTVVSALSRDLPTVVEQDADLPGYDIHRPERLDATGAPLPVIVWANGGCLRYNDVWKPLLDSWAAAGFVVVAIGTPVGTDPRTAARTTADDQAAAIDWAFAEDERPDSPYAGHLDLERVVSAGNSCGGITALTLASRDARVRSAFVLSGSSVFPGSSDEAAAAVMGDIRVPVGYATGGPEDISRVNVKRDHDLLPPGVPGYVALRSEATHEKVSTDPGILDEVAEISITWIDFTLYPSAELEQTLLRDPCPSCAPGTWTVEATDLDALVAP